jgi:hypothetical protein
MTNEITLRDVNDYCLKHNKIALIRHGQLRGFKGQDIFKYLGVDRI